MRNQSFVAWMMYAPFPEIGLEGEGECDVEREVKGKRNDETRELGCTCPPNYVVDSVALIQRQYFAMMIQQALRGK